MTLNFGQLQTLNENTIAAGDRIPVFDESESNLSTRTKAILLAPLRRFMHAGVDIQRSATRPTVRSDGGALVVGDRWRDTTENLWWYWNGTYWLSESIYFLQTVVSTALSASLFPGGEPIDPSGNNLFVINFRASVLFAAGTFDASNNWIIGAKRSNSANGAANLSTLTFNTNPVTARVFAQNNLALHIDVEATDTQHVYIDFARTGTPGNINIASTARLAYRLAKKAT